MDNYIFDLEIKKKEQAIYFLKLASQINPKGLDDRELEVLAAILVETSLAKSDIITADVRKKVCKKLKMLNYNMNTHIFRLKGKGYLGSKGGILRVSLPYCGFNMTDEKGFDLHFNIKLTK